MPESFVKILCRTIKLSLRVSVAVAIQFLKKAVYGYIFIVIRNIKML